MQTRSSDENSVRPSVCPSVTRVYCDKTVERSVQIFIPYCQDPSGPIRGPAVFSWGTGLVSIGTVR